MKDRKQNLKISRSRELEIFRRATFRDLKPGAFSDLNTDTVTHRVPKPPGKSNTSPSNQHQQSRIRIGLARGLSNSQGLSLLRRPEAVRLSMLSDKAEAESELILWRQGASLEPWNRRHGLRN